MRKILVILSLFVALFYLSTKDSIAACTPCTVGSGANICTVFKQCTVGGTNTGPINVGGSHYNCDTSLECAALNGQTINGVAQDPTCNGSGIKTAIGCINFQSPALFTGSILRWLVGIGGGIAFLLILSATFTIMSSGGNPERLKAGQEVLTSAVSGLILLIFSIFVLKLIGIDILGLDKFGFGGAPSGSGGSGGPLQIIK